MAYMCVYAHTHECDGCGICLEGLQDEDYDDFDELAADIAREEAIIYERDHV